MSQLIIDGKTILENIKLVLFDKDGTLIDIHHYWASMIRIRAALISQRLFPEAERAGIVDALVNAMGVDLKTGRMKPNGPVGIKPRPYIVNVAADVVRNNGCEFSNEEMESVFVEVDEQTSKDMLPLLKLLPGVEDLLTQLKECGIAAAIVSTDITSRARKAITALELDHFFTVILGGDSVAHTKPSPDLVELALQDLQYSVSDVAVVGDHPVDIEMGKNAGVGVNIGVLTGIAASEAFTELECNVISDLRAIEVRS